MPAAPTSTITANTFHPFAITQAHAVWTTELAALENLLNTNPTNGVGESAILSWFGQSTDRIGMLVFGLYRIIPTHVARELVIGRFRSDFAWVSSDPSTEPSVGFIELEEDLRNALFHTGSRSTPRMGAKFLSGFSQLSDWCSFGQADAAVDPAVSATLGAYRGHVHYYYSMIVGQMRFSPDALSRKRLAWWDENVNLGSGAKFKTYDQLINAVRQALSIRASL